MRTYYPDACEFPFIHQKEDRVIRYDKKPLYIFHSINHRILDAKKLHVDHTQWRNQTFSLGGGGGGWGGQRVVTLSKRSATIGWRVAYNNIFAKYTS